MLEKLKEFQIALLGLFLALAILCGSKIITNNVNKDGISVTGSAYETVKSDSATWRLSINTSAKTKAEAYNKITSQLPVIQDYLISQGIQKEQIDIIPANSYPTYTTNPKTGYSTNDVAYYNYSQPIKVSSNDVEKIKKLSNEIQNFVNQGINIDSNAPEYQYSKIADLKIKLLEAATKDSKERAKAMLSANKNHPGKILSVRMGVFQITAPDSTSVSDMGINDSSTIEKKVTAVANVTYQIK